MLMIGVNLYEKEGAQPPPYLTQDSGIGMLTFLGEKVLKSKRSSCIKNFELSHILFYRATYPLPSPHQILNSFAQVPRPVRIGSWGPPVAMPMQSIDILISF